MEKKLQGNFDTKIEEEQAIEDFADMSKQDDP